MIWTSHMTSLIFSYVIKWGCYITPTAPSGKKQQQKISKVDGRFRQENLKLSSHYRDLHQYQETGECYPFSSRAIGL